jgi:hypothetical protein
VLIDDKTRQRSLFIKYGLEQGEQLFIGIVIATLVDNGSRSLKESSIYNRGEDTIRSNPGFGPIDNTTLLQFVGDAIEDVVADVLFIRQNLVD